MNLKQLDLFVHPNTEASVYTDRWQQDFMGTIDPPPFNKSRSIEAGIELFEQFSACQVRQFEQLTMHFTRSGIVYRTQLYRGRAKMQVRRGKDGREHEICGKRRWSSVSTLR